MRVDLPPEHQERPFEHIAKHYAPEIAGAAGIYGTTPYQYSKLSLRELEAARFRTAQINGCNTCMNFRGQRDFPGLFEVFQGDLENSVYSRGPAPDEEFYRNVENWREYEGFSDRERLVIRYAEGMGQNPHGIAQDEDFWQRAKAEFSDDELVGLTYSIAAWMANGRALHVLGLDAVCSFVPAGKAEAA
ncbi:MAG: carboxymuconolactone decarboxylase family protein [Novosphingobium sp.]|nr:carboxymuconolactone decarboxylase family protein [Novosphingobium sp.]